MKKVLEISDLFGNKVNLNKMEILATGKDWVVAKFVDFGFTKTFSPCDGYKVVFED